MTQYLTPIAVIIGLFAWVYISWKLGIKTANAQATDNWKEAYESEKTLREQREAQIAKMELEYGDRIARLEVKMNAFEKENIGLTKEVNVLKQVKPSEMFEETVTRLLEEIKQSREDFQQHAADDQEAFTNMWERIDRTNDIAIENHNMLKKLCKEG